MNIYEFLNNFNSRWLPQLINPSRHKHGSNWFSFTDTEQNVGVVVAESRSQLVPQAQTEHGA